MKKIIKTARLLAIAGAMFISAAAAYAQELLFSGGQMHAENEKSSYAWQLMYKEGLGEYAAWSLSWINEGHFPAHHRDGPALQLWARKQLFDGRLAFAVGTGPYRFFDTEQARKGHAFRDVHGTGLLSSVSATFYTKSRLVFQLKGDYFGVDSSLRTTAVTFGIGYQLQKPEMRGPNDFYESEPGERGKNAFTAYMGSTIVNSFSSQESHAFAFDYRRELKSWLDVSAGWLHEGDSRLIRRDGVIAQLWPKRTFFDGRFSIGLGMGAYMAADTRRKSSDGEIIGDRFLSGLLSLGADIEVYKGLYLRGVWNRTVTTYSRDTDVMLAGLGLRF